MQQPWKKECADEGNNRYAHLHVDMVSHIASYLHSDGKTIARNSSSFFSLQTRNKDSMARLGLHTEVLSERLGIINISKAVNNVINGYYQNTSLCLMQREKLLNLFISRLKNSDFEENQTLALEEIERFTL